MNDSPRVIIGLPVYNGQNYLKEAIESVLAQTFTNFLLVISDNASTDATEAICREYAEKDDRIIYHRQSVNIGCAPNFNFVFEQYGKNAPYFKWHAHDDLIAPKFLERCVALLDTNPEFVIANCRAIAINEQGTQIGTFDHEIRLSGETPSERFWRSLWAGYFTEHFGLQRASVLEKACLYASFTGSDRNFAAELVLQGDVGYVEEYLYARRDHPDCYCRIKDQAEKLAFFDPKIRRELWRLTGLIKMRAYLDAIVRLPLPLSEQIRCIRMLTEWTLRRGIESATGVGEKFGDQFRREFAANREWLDNAQTL
ncbi:MAG: glycosyltransferase family 2 protein [Leptolyngbya sp. Prado105]|jgi:glycosyltransferase involved in cell wall biosynthesis|nr:glycosyltransferase family 2 protein [Leptolyngbya sp. Prado105]